MSICQLYKIQVFCSRQFSALCNLRWKAEGRDQQKAKVFQGVVSICERGQLYEGFVYMCGYKNGGGSHLHLHLKDLKDPRWCMSCRSWDIEKTLKNNH